MTITPAVIWGPIQIGSSTGVLGAAVPANGIQIIKRAVFTNTDTVPVTITINVVRSGGSVSTANEVIAAFSLSAGQAYVSPELANLVLTGGDAVYGLASIAAQITTMASGFQQ